MSVNRLMVLYAGETGNSEDVARIVYRQSKKFGVPVKAICLSDYLLSDILNEHLVLFICSTTGQGNEPTPLRSFWAEIMKRNLPSHHLNHLSAAVIGLGDSSYIKYNVVGKKLFKRLQSLGAQMILDLALGDDQHDLGLWASIDPWLNRFWATIEGLIPVSMLNDSDLFKPRYAITLEGLSPSQLDETINPIIISNDRVTPIDHFQEVRFIRIDLNGQSNLNYSPGDVALVQPKNYPDEVDLFMKLLNLDPNQSVQCKRVDDDFIESNGYNNLPTQLDVRSLIAKYLDIHSVPKRSFFDLLWKFSPDEVERTKLKEFASTEGQQDLYNYCHKPKRSILEVLIDFPHTSSKIPLDSLPDLIPCIRPRAFSIASSILMHPNELHLLVTVVKYQTKLRKPRLGLCSNYLSRVRGGDHVSLAIRSGEFKVPQNDPLIMVGPGTGVAPFRSIIQHRVVHDIRENVLFFGCRYSKADYYFKDEWADHQASGHLKVFTAFSRDIPDKKWYVQDEILANQEILIDFMFNKKCTILIAGSSNQMPDDVRNCIKQIILKANDELDQNEVEKFLSRLEATRKIQYECWS